MKERGFDTETYVDIQSKTILERVSKFGEKLYLEFGGKLSNDFHAARVLPGYQPNAKIQVLKRIQDMSEIYYCVSAKDIQRGRVRHDFGLSYDQQALKDIAFLSEQGLNISGVVITRYEGESLAERFYNKLQHQNIPVFLHREIPGYPLNIDLVVSEKAMVNNLTSPRRNPSSLSLVPVAAAAKCLSAWHKSTTKPNGESAPVLPNSRLSPFGICPLIIRSTSPTKQPLPIWAI